MNPTFFPSDADFVYRNAFLIMKLYISNPPSVFKRVLECFDMHYFGNRFVIHRCNIYFKTIICSSVRMKKSHKIPLIMEHIL